MSVIIDTFTVLLALYALLLFVRKPTSERYKLETLLSLTAIGSYIIAQSGWTAAFLTGNVWGVVYNNYIWFIFNTVTMLLIITQAKK